MGKCIRVSVPAGLLLGFLLHALSVLAQTGDREAARPVILDGRVTGVETSVEGSTEALSYTVEVEHVVSGFPPVLLVAHGTVENPSNGSDLRSGVLHRYRVDERLRLVLEPLLDGTFRILSARTAQIPSDVDLDPTPGGISMLPAELHDSRLDRIFAVGSYEEQVVEIVNQERWSNGQLPPLKKVGPLDTSSETHSSNMENRDFFAHCDLDTGTSPGVRMVAAGYSGFSMGENIAAGYATPASVMAGWMSSSGHKANILSLGYREIGVGYVNDPSDAANVRRDTNSDCIVDVLGGPYIYYWTQNFGRRIDVFPLVIDREAYETTAYKVDLYVYGTPSSGDNFTAQDMRFKNESGAWSAWEPYNPNKAWTLSYGDGAKEVFAEIRNATSTVLSASDTILLAAGCTVPDIDLDLTSQTISDSQVYEACSSISAGPAFAIVSPGDVTFRAPTIVLKDGFSAGSGVKLTAVNEVP